MEPEATIADLRNLRLRRDKPDGGGKLAQIVSTPLKQWSFDTAPSLIYTMSLGACDRALAPPASTYGATVPMEHEIDIQAQLSDLHVRLVYLGDSL